MERRNIPWSWTSSTGYSALMVLYACIRSARDSVNCSISYAILNNLALIVTTTRVG